MSGSIRRDANAAPAAGLYDSASGAVITQTGVDILADGLGPANVAGAYRDLGLALDAGAIPAGATVWSSYYIGLGWVRGGVILSQCDQIYDLLVMRQDSTPITGWGSNIATSQSSTGTSSYRESVVTLNGGVFLVGHAARFGIKNTAGSVSTVGKVRVQLLG